MKLVKILKEAQWEGNNLKESNSYYEIIKPFPLYVMTGSHPSNAYYGAGRLFEPEWKKITAKKGDQIQNLAGGLFYVEKSKKAYNMHLQEPEFRPFERGRGSFDKFDLSKLKEVDESQAIGKIRVVGR